jgi:hypothetical protein
MKITRLSKNGQKVNSELLNKVQVELFTKFKKAGFITEVDLAKGKIGMHMCSFRIDTNKLGYNAQVSDLTVKTCKTGYKRTATPTWIQREEFNHIVNNVFDKYKLTAKIVSGDYLIRCHESGRVNDWAMPETYHTGYRLQVPSVLEVVPMEYASVATEWVGINAPFISVVPATLPRFKKIA